MTDASRERYGKLLHRGTGGIAGRAVIMMGRAAIRRDHEAMRQLAERLVADDPLAAACALHLAVLTAQEQTERLAKVDLAAAQRKAPMN